MDFSKLNITKNPSYYLEHLEELLSLRKLINPISPEIEINPVYNEIINHYIIKKFITFIRNLGQDIELTYQHDKDKLIYKFNIRIVKNDQLLEFDYMFFVVEEFSLIKFSEEIYYHFDFDQYLKTFTLINMFIISDINENLFVDNRINVMNWENSKWKILLMIGLLFLGYEKK